MLTRFCAQNQWGEFVVQDVESKEYGRPLSTVFGLPEKKYFMSYDYDDDPVLDNLRLLDYRYMRFSFNPLKDRFLLCNSEYPFHPALSGVLIVWSSVQISKLWILLVN